jgi:hypothetical protein
MVAWGGAELAAGWQAARTMAAAISARVAKAMDDPAGDFLALSEFANRDLIRRANIGARCNGLLDGWMVDMWILLLGSNRGSAWPGSDGN